MDVEFRSAIRKFVGRHFVFFQIPNFFPHILRIAIPCHRVDPRIAFGFLFELFFILRIILSFHFLNNTLLESSCLLFIIFFYFSNRVIIARALFHSLFEGRVDCVIESALVFTFLCLTLWKDDINCKSEHIFDHSWNVHFEKLT